MSKNEEFAERLHKVSARLENSRQLAGISDADPGSGEQWDQGQVWAHLAEFVPYWLAEARLVIDNPSDQPVEFGRVKSDPVRIAAIETGRQLHPNEQWQVLQAQIEDLRDFINQVDEPQWGSLGIHQTRNTMSVADIVDEFLVGHLEEHADQLAGLS